MKKFLWIISLFIAVQVHASNGIQAVSVVPSIAASSAPLVAGVSAVVTISSPVATTYSSGLNTYVSNLHIEAYYKGGIVGASTPVQCTSTNLPGSPAWDFVAAVTTNTMQVTDMQFANPLINSNSAVNTVVTCPANANIQWNVTVGYIQAP